MRCSANSNAGLMAVSLRVYGIGTTDCIGRSSYCPLGDSENGGAESMQRLFKVYISYFVH